MEWLFCCSIVNLMLGCLLFKKFEKFNESCSLPKAARMSSTSHSALKRRGDIATTSLRTSQQRRRYISNETPNDISMEVRQEVSVVRLHHVLLERRSDVSKGCNNKVPSLRRHDFSSKSQMKHPRMPQWYVTKTPQWYVSTTSH